MASSYTSSALIVADKLADFIDDLNFTATVTLAVDGIYNTSTSDSCQIIVSPLTTVIGRDARDVVRERVGTQVTVIKRSGSQNVNVDALIADVETLQKGLFFADLTDGSKRWFVEEINLNSAMETSGGDVIDGIYNGDDLGDAGVFKTSMIIVSSRFLKASRN